MMKEASKNNLGERRSKKKREIERENGRGYKEIIKRNGEVKWRGGNVRQERESGDEEKPFNKRTMNSPRITFSRFTKDFFFVTVIFLSVKMSSFSECSNKKISSLINFSC